MLEDALNRYKNQVIGVTDILQELIAMSKDVQAAKQRGEELGLEPYELAFYDALAQNDSAREVMGQDKLRELAIVLVSRVRKNATIDWNLKESVRARMKVMVKRLLRQYGYPPDMQALAIELVLEQAKVFADFEVLNALVLLPVVVQKSDSRWSPPYWYYLINWTPSTNSSPSPCAPDW
jgi:type I restriction enzyme R subunit